MNLSFRALCFPLVIALVGLPPSILAAQHIPLPPKHKNVVGGNYVGPGDTVPPCVPPGCQPLPQICSGPCPSNYQTFGCSSACFGSPQGTHVAGTNWTDENGVSIPPECMQVAGDYTFYQITIKNLLDAANASGSSYPRSNLCFFENCALGVDSLFVYTAKSFQYHPTGVPTGTGGYMQVCGMNYGFKLLNDDGVTCTDLGGQGSLLVNETSASLSCATNLSRMSLQFDVSCLNQILNYYAALGLYNPVPQANAFLDENDVVFVVIVKCCSPGGPDCE